MAESLFSELQRRNVVRVAVAYIVASWIIVQALSLFLDIYQAPAWVMQVIVSLLFIGFPISVFFAWAFEITPEGIKRESEVVRNESIVHITAKRLDYLTIFMVLIGIGLLVADRFLLDNFSPNPDKPMQSHTKSGSEYNSQSDSIPVVAVLPFKATGSDDGGFLASGLHDDLLTRLAKLKAFKVISRTSMQEYADTTKNMKQIGVELGADYILEGGVQSHNNRIRINAQLIRASEDEHVWAEIYDRQLTATDIFEIQGELSIAIAKEMKRTLSLTDQNIVQDIPTDNIDAYNAYLRGIELEHQEGRGRKNAREAYQKAVELDPDFALAWARLSESYSRLSRNDDDQTARDLALKALAKARALKPDLYEAELAWVVYLYHGLRDYNQALAALDALDKKSNLNADAIELKAWLYRRIGKYKLAYQTMLKAKQLEPRDISHARDLVQMAYISDDCISAKKHLDEALKFTPDAFSIIWVSLEYEFECTGDLKKIAAIIDRNHAIKDSLIQFRFTLVYAKRDYQKLFSIIDSLQPLNTSKQAQLFRRINRAVAFTLLKENNNSTEELKVIGSLLEQIENDEQEPFRLSSTFSLTKFWYASLLKNQEQVLYWLNDHKTKLKEEIKGDLFIYSRNQLSWASFLSHAGLHKQAIKELRETFENPGGNGFNYVKYYEPFDVLHQYPEFVELKEKYSQVRCTNVC